jgi:hypothetical protein
MFVDCWLRKCYFFYVIEVSLSIADFFFFLHPGNLATTLASPWATSPSTVLSQTSDGRCDPWARWALSSPSLLPHLHTGIHVLQLLASASRCKLGWTRFGPTQPKKKHREAYKAASQPNAAWSCLVGWVGHNPI